MRKAILITLVLGANLAAANANLVWDWSFGTESGQFVTDGTSFLPGQYTLQNFIVTGSSVGAAIGSLNAGDYVTGAAAFSTYQPFSFTWNGTSVTTWNHAAGGNSFDWWAFDDVREPGMYFFGWALGNINDPTSGAYWLNNSGAAGAPALGTISVTPVPEPSTVVAGCLALLTLIGPSIRRRR